MNAKSKVKENLENAGTFYYFLSADYFRYCYKIDVGSRNLCRTCVWEQNSFLLIFSLQLEIVLLRIRNIEQSIYNFFYEQWLAQSWNQCLKNWIFLTYYWGFHIFFPPFFRFLPFSHFEWRSLGVLLISSL